MKYLKQLFEVNNVDYEGRIIDNSGEDLTIIPFIKRNYPEQQFIATIKDNGEGWEKSVIINSKEGTITLEYEISLETFFRRCRTGQYIPEYLPKEYYL